MSCLQYVLDQGQRDDWFSDQTIVLCAWACAFATAAFVWWELRVAEPIVDLRILRQPAVAAALAIAGAYAAIIFPSLLLLPQFTVDGLGFTSTLAGILIGARALPVLLLTLPVARLVAWPRFDLRWSIGGGLAVAGLGSLWLGSGVTTASALSTFVVPLLVMGAGAAFVYSPLLVATMRAVAPEAGPKPRHSSCSSFSSAARSRRPASWRLFDRRLQFHQTVLAAQETLSRLPVAQFLQNGSREQLAAAVAAQAGALAYADAFFITGVLALLIAPGALLLARRRAG